MLGGMHEVFAFIKLLHYISQGDQLLAACEWIGSVIEARKLCVHAPYGRWADVSTGAQIYITT